MWRYLRIGFLLFILFLVGVGSLLQKKTITSWQKSLWVVVYPINADGSVASNKHIKKLRQKTFIPVENFFVRAAKQYANVITPPIDIKLGPTINELPPKRPSVKANSLAIAWWSLKLRYWMFRLESKYNMLPANIRVFVLYHDPKIYPVLGHSVGLEKGLVGLVNAFASKHQNAQNNVIIAHEILHTFGATDKYELGSGYPIFPIGFADPQQKPLYPQKRTEIMGGRAAIDAQQTQMPLGLKSCVVGPMTASEIGWATIK